MNIKRAIGFGALLYVLLFVVYGLTFILPFLDPNELSLRNFVFIWLVNIPVVLLLAKWFFKSVKPTTQSGWKLGVVALIFGLSLDLLGVIILSLMGESIDVFKDLYTNWKFYFTVVEIILLTTYAGWEFDGSLFEQSTNTSK